MRRVATCFVLFSGLALVSCVAPTSPVVTQPNLYPVAVVSASPLSGDVPLDVAFDGSGSSDPDGSISSYAWDFGDGSTGVGVTISHTYLTAGNFAATLTVTDNRAATRTAAIAISVATPNVVPVAVVSASPLSGDVPLDVAFDGSGSSDPDGSISSYAWDFGDGSTGVGVTISHTYLTAGNFAATLTVTDNRGGTGTSSVDVLSAIPPTPTVQDLALSTPTSTKVTAVFSVDWKGRTPGSCTVSLNAGTPIPGTCSSITVSGLAAGALYSVVVRAVNTTGQAASASASITTPGRRSITSYNRMAPGAPYWAYFLQSWQSFTAQSNTLTYVGVTVGRSNHVQGQQLRVRMCSGVDATNGCSGTTYLDRYVTIQNYGNSEIDVGDIAINPGQNYYIVWTQPTGLDYRTYWWGGGATISSSDQMQMIVQGYNR